VRLGDTSDVDASEGALTNPKSHTFGLPVVGGALEHLNESILVRANVFSCL
jgi:hypothetical protein